MILNSVSHNSRIKTAGQTATFQWQKRNYVNYESRSTTLECNPCSILGIIHRSAIRPLFRTTTSTIRTEQVSCRHHHHHHHHNRSNSNDSNKNNRDPEASIVNIFNRHDHRRKQRQDPSRRHRCYQHLSREWRDQDQTPLKNPRIQ